jgi:hypothetical protein
MADTVRVTFQYALGQHVRWVGHTALSWIIATRQYHEGTVSRVVTYGLVLSTARPEERAVTAPELDLEPWEEPP